MTRAVLLTLPLLALSGAAFAASTPEQVLNDPNRPVKAVAAELGVTPLEFASCFAGVTPARTAIPSGSSGRCDRRGRPTSIWSWVRLATKPAC